MKFQFLAVTSLLTFMGLTIPASLAQTTTPDTIASRDHLPASADNKARSLRIEKSILGIKNPSTDKIDPVSEPVFTQGDIVALVLINVGKFRKGSDGLHHFDMDMEIKNSRGRVIGSKRNLLGEGGHLLLPDDIAESPYGSIDTNVSRLQPGRYSIKLTIYDQVGGGRATSSKTFTLREPS